MDTENSTYPQSRRSFLVHSAQALVGLTAFSIPEICSAKVASGKRSVYLYHANQRKELKLTYAVGNLYDPRALALVNSFLRDYHTGQIHRIDPKLLDILWAVQQETGAKGAYKVVSAFRSPQTNRKLSRTHRGVADHSLHMKGRAVDLSHPDVRLSQIRHCAMNMRTGGVGYYPRSNFVHLDTGMYRTW